MLFSDITVIDEDFEAKPHQWVGTRDGKIAYVGSAAPAAEQDFGEVYDGTRKVLMPGMYNAHAHAPMTLLRGYAEDLPLQSWLNDAVFPFEAQITDEAAYPATLLAIAEMLRHGTVSFSDMYYYTDMRAKAVLESGIKCNLSEAALSFEETPYDELPIKALNERYVRDYHNAGDGRLKVDLSVHAEYTSNPLLVEGVGQQAVDLGVRTHIHMSETKSEHEECKQRHNGMSPAAYFESLGFFRQPCTAAHCVWTDEADWEILKRNGVTATTNPASNLKLGSGIAPVPAMLDAGVSVALGTDGVASNNNHDMFQDMYLLSVLQKGATGDPTVLGPQQALRIACRNGALSQGRDDCGLVKEGFKADLVVLDFDQPHLYPATNVVNNLVYSAHGSDVCLTMVDGRVLYRDGEFPTIDVERAAHDTETSTQAILQKLA